MTTKFHRVAAIGVAVLISAGTLVACGANDAAEGGDDPVIALLLPETKTTRYETFDKPLFEAKVKELCEECEVKYFNADGDVNAQSEQVDSAITQGADVVVLDPVDANTATSLIKTARESDVPTVAYDRFIEGADYYMSFDNETVGRMQGEALIEAMGDKGSIIMLNGDPRDPNAPVFKKGAHSAIDKSNLKVIAEYDNPDWSPENANQFTTDQLTRFGNDRIQGIYAANDGQAGGAISALKGADVKELPPVTGQDAEVTAIQRIVAGEQRMTIYKSIKEQAEKAAEVAVAIARGDEVTGASDYEGVPSFIFDPVVVTQDNIMDTVVADGFWSVDDICTADYADACAAAGVK
ncbi:MULTISPECIES: sugar ABC transporter substrate-binding protein [unclassified Nocardioides]|uniref:sugar ABC transporter substrate-binding protein n=1 Tax=unclassified Nocardioides TaxID=2615069 RepID=UPI0006F613FF|nr:MULTISPECIES: substrate-binding domain-containing protein [unclassified Nocardioides]KQY56551.1 ABC transporter substrate-binding protein [Nocardioides sp. Root140]KQZ75305.1 ABC transporter substrate-binding protein [Nocardioides sp. Root151]KRF14385.1 ABC transporter substrate-binding protein [Nocardioides sp. Soil796]